MIGDSHLYVGNEASAKRGILALRYPITHGVVTDWENMEALWAHTFQNELRVDARCHPIFMTEPAMNPRENRNKMAHLMFEKFEVPGLFVSVQAIPSLFSSGKRSGVVLDAGDGVCHAVPVLNGKPIKHAATRLELGGRDCTNYLVKLLTDDNVFLSSTSAERDIVRDIKETAGYVALDYQAELARPPTELSTPYRMPDAEIIHVTRSRFKCAEPLFEPMLLGKDTLGVVKMLHESVTQCEPKDHAALWGNVVLAGGTTLFKGFKERVDHDLRVMMGKDAGQVKITAPDNRIVSVWLGAALMASNHEIFCDQCISRADFLEQGDRAVSRFEW
eukprot:TRINITY_DN4856_c1_g1_i1.p1 TRINITY_DN4856_c1_g1~~TRINITY_DN4856_c1_g1_i1.p1  ORF type:complete len:365 (+),score=92.69 TRINITY_DN4856_c1_g1_i1:101-1096(+)